MLGSMLGTGNRMVDKIQYFFFMNSNRTGRTCGSQSASPKNPMFKHTR